MTRRDRPRRQPAHHRRDGGHGRIRVGVLPVNVRRAGRIERVARYATWANAATTIQAAVGAVSTGGTVLVTNGVYAAGGAANASPAISNRVLITQAITVQSVNGPSVTFIKGAPDPITGGLGTNATRCVYMSAGVLAGFTLTNGYTRADSRLELPAGRRRGVGHRRRHFQLRRDRLLRVAFRRGRGLVRRRRVELRHRREYGL